MLHGHPYLLLLYFISIQYQASVITLIAGIILLGLAWLNEYQTAPAINQQNQTQMDVYQFSDTIQQHSDAINSMGMQQAISTIFDEKTNKINDPIQSIHKY